MVTKYGLRKSAGLSLAVVAALGLSLMPLAVPQRAAAQEHSAAQPGAHPMNVGLPKPDTGQPNGRSSWQNWSGRQAFFGQATCLGGPGSLFYDPLLESPFGNQPAAFAWGNPGMQGWFGGPAATSWYGYTSSQLTGWSYSSFNLSPVPGSCGGFQALTP
jgi:hypothetical protein